MNSDAIGHTLLRRQESKTTLLVKGLLGFLACALIAVQPSNGFRQGLSFVREQSRAEGPSYESLLEYLRWECFPEVPPLRQGETLRLEATALDRLSGLPRWLRLVVYDEALVPLRMSEKHVDACYRDQDAVGGLVGPATETTRTGTDTIWTTARRTTTENKTPPSPVPRNIGTSTTPPSQTTIMSDKPVTISAEEGSSKERRPCLEGTNHNWTIFAAVGGVAVGVLLGMLLSGGVLRPRYHLPAEGASVDDVALRFVTSQPPPSPVVPPSSSTRLSHAGKKV